MKRTVIALECTLLLAALVAGPLLSRGGGMGGGGGGMMMTKEQVGKMIYCDCNLSTPAGQSCQTCHSPTAGYADPNQSLPVSKGIIVGRFGNRNSPTSAYLATLPDFHFDSVLGYVGGQFWDGRALNLVEQAKGPFLNPLEMNNPSMAAVVSKAGTACYATGFRQIYGQNVFQNVEYAYHCIADALAAYEKSPELNNYNSKYDQYRAGTATLTTQERRGLVLFEGRAGCASCHTPPVFTRFTYHNIGTPRNSSNPFYSLPPEFNPLGSNWIDYGLGNVTGQSADAGKFKVPTLRNIARTAPYMHNGVFTTLYSAVSFINNRNAPGCWPPEVPYNIHPSVGALGLSGQDVTDIVSFLNTLSDSGGGCGGGGGGCGRMGG